MTPLEKRVWAAAYALYWKEHMEAVGRHASMGHYKTGAGTYDVHTKEEKTPGQVEDDNREGAEIAATTSAVEWADQAVLYLRLHQKANDGELHVDEDLELERRGEEA